MKKKMLTIKLNHLSCNWLLDCVEVNNIQDDILDKTAGIVNNCG